MGYLSTNVDGPDGTGSFALFRNNWQLDKIAHEDGPTMSFGGTIAKLFILLVLFTVGFLVSWHHFYVLSTHLTADEKVHVIYHEMQAWQGEWPYVDFRYPLYAWLIFFLFFGGTFFTKRALMIVAPLSAVVLGVSCGSFEFLLHEHYPWITLISGLLVIGLFIGLIGVYWLGFVDMEDVDTSNVFGLFAAGAGGGLVFCYVATDVIRSFGVAVPFPHQISAHWNLFMLMGVLLACGMLMNTLHEIHQAIAAGVPKWVEWRAAVCLFASFVILLKLIRRLLLRRSTGGLIWDMMKEAFPKTLR